MKFQMENIPAYQIAYKRKIGPYGSENIKAMEALKVWAKRRGLMSDDTIILGLAQDDPSSIAPEVCRYDVCIVLSEVLSDLRDEMKLARIVGGKYLVFEIAHTVEAVSSAWENIFTILTREGYVFDVSRPIMERYKTQMIEKHLCEICVPLL